MSTPDLGSNNLELNPATFNQIRKRIYDLAGISLAEGKRLMVEGRLAKRVRAAGVPSYEAYLALIDRSGRGSEEETAFINALTTNKTEFFREEHHFDHLASTVFPGVIDRAERGGPKRLRIWCAAASTGEEPWSLAMTVFESFGVRPGWDVQIVASDIDTNVLQTAQRGVYEEERMAGVSTARRARHFQTGKGEAAGWFRVREHLRSLVSFRRVNLIGEKWDIPAGIDVIFCRNVIIYFDRPTQTKLFARMAELMTPGGFLFAGHSESLLGVTDRFVPVGNTVYRVDTGSSPRTSPPIQAPEAEPRAPAPPPPRPHPVVRPRAAEHVRPHRAVVTPSTAPEPAADGLPIKRIIVGEVHASDKPVRIATVLGSCVAACLWDPVSRIGGMNHFLLPDGDHGSGDDAARYGIHAMELLINRIMNLGGDRRRLQAKVLGASQLSNIQSNVASRNAAFVRQFLADEGIVITAERLLGPKPLEVHFLPHTGNVLVREVGRNVVSEMETRATRLARAPAEPTSTPSVTLF